MTFCKKHRLPENHNCPFDLIQKTHSENGLKINLIYSNALKFLNKDLTVGKIYDYVSSKKLNKNDATELLNYFIENNEDIEVRKNSILAFEILELKNKNAFKILEKCLISDNNSTIRQAAARVLSINFPKKSKDLLEWVKIHNKNIRS
jgi:HEAT repeat protein